MVVFVDLNDDPEPPRLGSHRNDAPIHWLEGNLTLHPTRAQPIKDPAAKLAERSNPNRNAVTAALGCYPYAPTSQPHV
jgi:hypothetical protein